jgi:hypothetical protein
MCGRDFCGWCQRVRCKQPKYLVGIAVGILGGVRLKMLRNQAFNRLIWCRPWHHEIKVLCSQALFGVYWVLTRHSTGLFSGCTSAGGGVI